jgi:hypothetical protein
MALDAPQMWRKSTEEAVFDGCLECFRPIMMTTGQLCLARPRLEQAFAKSSNYDPPRDVSIVVKDLK